MTYFSSTSIPDRLASVPNKVEQILEDLPFPSGLKINRQKTRHSSKRCRRKVTGLVLGSDQTVHLGCQRKRWIRSLLFKYESLDETQKASLAGILAFARNIEPDLINSLVIKFGYDRLAAAQRHKTQS
jgi:RNA-directed DNA polymerase